MSASDLLRKYLTITNRFNSSVFSVGALLLCGMSIYPNALAQSTTLSESDGVSEQNSSSTLLSGVYYRRSYIGIYQYGERICYTGGNNRGVTTASVEEDSEKTGIYRINGFDAGTGLFQVDSDTLHFGGAEYERIEEARSFEDLSPRVQACLSSQEPYLNQESF